jgi:hypothetical protein
MPVLGDEDMQDLGLNLEKVFLADSNYVAVLTFFPMPDVILKPCIEVRGLTGIQCIDAAHDEAPCQCNTFSAAGLFKN